VSQDEGNALFGAEVGEPVPGEDTFDGDDEAVTIGSNGLEKGFGSGFHVAVQHDVTIVTQDTNVHRTGMSIDTAIKWVWMGVESHEVSSFLVNFFSTTSIPLGYAEGEASYIIKGVQPTPSSVRSAPASRRG
jgi:hypothetical protein